jgi:hypothetical protein
MAKLVVCAVRDAALQAYARPFFVPTKGVAMRSFRDEVKRKAEDNPMHQHPEDYELFALGTFDEASGVFELEGFERLARAVDVMEV